MSDLTFPFRQASLNRFHFRAGNELPNKWVFLLNEFFIRAAKDYATLTQHQNFRIAETELISFLLNGHFTSSLTSVYAVVMYLTMSIS